MTPNTGGMIMPMKMLSFRINPSLFTKLQDKLDGKNLSSYIIQLIRNDLKQG